MPHKSVRSMNALNLAAFNGHEQEVQFLLAIKKYDINAADKTRGNPLMWASRNGHNKIVQASGSFFWRTRRNRASTVKARSRCQRPW